MSDLVRRENIIKIAEVSYMHGLRSGLSFLRDHFNSEQQALILDPVNKDVFSEVEEKIVQAASQHYTKELEEIILKEGN